MLRGFVFYVLAIELKQRKRERMIREKLYKAS